MGKIIAILALVLVFVAIGLGGFLWWSNHSATKLAVKEQTAAGNATVGQGQAQNNAAAQTITVAGQARDTVDLEVHEHNDQTIASSPGADQPLDPRLVRNLDVGLCEHAAFRADPGCAGLLPGNSSQLPGPGDGSAAAAP